VKKSLNSSLKKSILAAIAVSCVTFVSACQQPEQTTTAPTTTSTASPTASASPSASPTATATTEPDTTTSTNAPSLDKVAGQYNVVLDPKVLADAEKDGVKSVTGQWTIKPEGTFEATLKAVSTKDEVQEIKTAGKITIEDGKVVSQVETVNGEQPPQAPPKQPYTLSADGKELQADGQPVKLVKQ
jgi:hypothetical protein